MVFVVAGLAVLAFVQPVVLLMLVQRDYREHATAVSVDHHEQMAALRGIVAAASPDLCEMVALVDRAFNQVDDLCQRIQAPQVAVMAHANGTLGADMPMHVPLDDDDEHWVAKEELADRAFREELGGRR